MEPQVMICFAITILMMVLFIWNPYNSLATTSVIGIVLYFVTGCVDEEVIVSSFGSTAGLLTCAMFVVSAGFNKTQFVKNLAEKVHQISKGNLSIVIAGYGLIAIMLTQFVPSTLVPFCILAPMLANTAEKMGYSPSKVMFPIGVICITTIAALPVGGSAASYVSLNAQMEAYGALPTADVFSKFSSRAPLVVLLFLYCVFIAPKFCPDHPSVDIVSVDKMDGKGSARAQKELEKAQLPAFQEAAALVIFFLVTVALIFSSTLGLENWMIAMVGAILMIITGVLKPKEASKAIPIWICLMFVGGLVIAGALTNTGAGDMIGAAVGSIVGRYQSNILYYLVICIGAYVATQFLNNRTTNMIFYPIIIQTCLNLGADPLGGMLCAQAATQCAFITPTATSTVAYIMGAGGYDLKTMLKMGWLPTVLCFVVLSTWMSFMYPVF